MNVVVKFLPEIQEEKKKSGDGTDNLFINMYNYL
jgi:hypothetical protein